MGLSSPCRRSRQFLYFQGQLVKILEQNQYLFRGSSMAEQEAVNFKVVGSNPARGAKNVVVTPPGHGHILVLSALHFHSASSSLERSGKGEAAIQPADP